MDASNAQCSFCRKSCQQAGLLVEGAHNVYICGECVTLCESIIDQEKRRRKAASGSPATDAQALRSALDGLISNQEHAKAVISDTLCHRHETRRRVLLVCPNQSSAMFLAKATAFALDVPFAAGDWRGLTKTGKENLFFDLLAAAEFDLERTQHGVLFAFGMDAVQAQTALANVWRQGSVSPVADLTIVTRAVRFVCGGAFPRLDEHGGSAGSGIQPTITVNSLIAAGACPEWSAALGAIARVSPLDEQSLMRILNWVDFRQAERFEAEQNGAAERGCGCLPMVASVVPAG